MKLEKHLVLNKYFLNLFNFNNFDELREKLKDTEESYDNFGRSYFIDSLIRLKPQLEDLLLRYDLMIKEYVEKLKQNRKDPNFKLKYFQYLAVLFTEIYLDKYHNDKEFLNELNLFLNEFNNINKTKITPFTKEDLKKLAFWMATGSGKTLILHINYFQMLKYSNNWDNIILITPNEGLSKQHYEELKLSGIPCKLYDGNIDNLKTKEKEVLVIDIHKLTKEKKGDGVSVDISYFDSKNLVFIDEGHKGAGGESEIGWKKLREEIAKDGFLFEYSATFGQIIGKNKDLLQEYAKAIIFNYSYKYFYTDGYGKDFYVYNIKTEKKDKKESYSKKQQYLLLTAGLLSFYEQLVVFEENKEKLREYNIEKPLWIFVGSKVTGKGVNSDVLKVIKFIDEITKNEKEFKKNVKKILSGNSGLIDNKGNDIFKDKFEYIKKLNQDTLIDDIYQKVFNGKGKLELYEIKSSDEIALKTSTAEKYFGVINVGDIRALKKLLDIEVKEDHFTQSLFFDINTSNSYINVLIGSKKFIEGWNSWRVSNMGLINMGQNEGPQIIQLFGRGVRLKGKNYSLKREENPDYKLKILQTLFIFGLNAVYINAFLKTIESEEVDYEEIEIPIKFNNPNKWEGDIYTIKTKEDFNFLEHPLKLELDEKILKNIKIDLRSKVTIANGLEVDIAEDVIDGALKIQQEDLRFIDLDFIYLEVMDYKIANGMYNLIIDIDTIKKIISSKRYKIFLNKSEGIDIQNNSLKIVSFEGVKKFNDIILMLIKEYIFKFYKNKERKKAMDYLDIEPLTIKKHSFMYPKIIVKIQKELITDIEKIIKELNEYEPDNNKIPKNWLDWKSFIVHFDKHLYTPLIVWKKNKDKIKSIPVKLNEGETNFVSDFKDFLQNSSLKDKEIFLLRNLSKKGIGFFINSGFYPDFIIWIKKENRQHIIFVDPKGIRNLGNFNDEKIKFCTSYIKKIEEKINEKEEINLQLDAFILSTSSYEDIKDIFGEGNHTKKEFEEHNILFQEDKDYIRKLFKIVTNNDF